MKKGNIITIIICVILLAGAAWFSENGFKTSMNKYDYTRSFALVKNNMAISLGQKEKLNILSIPENVTIKDLVWISSDESIAIVTSDGQIIGKKPGHVKITATVKSNNNKKDECNVEIKGVNKIIMVSSISLDTYTMNVTVGHSFKLHSTIFPSNATNKYVTWSSSNNIVATVNDDGLVVAKAAGEAIIAATSIDGSNKQAIMKLTVSIPENPSILVKKITLNTINKEIKVGESFQLTSTISPHNAFNKNVRWTSSNEKVAIVNNNGLVEAKEAGIATVTVASTDGSNKSAAMILVVKKNSKPIIPISNINLNVTNKELKQGETFQLVANIKPSNATSKSVLWSSSNTNIATINNNGLITAKNIGTVIIKATSTDGSNKSTEMTLFVKNQNILVNNLKLNFSSAEIKLGETLQLAVTISPNNAMNKSITWSSSNANVATISNGGRITTKGIGTTTITVKTNDGSNKSTAMMLTVKKAATPIVLVNNITLNVTNKELYSGGTLQLIATIKPSNATNKGVTWSSSNTNIATVNSNGFITAKGPGTTKITVSSIDGTNKMASMTLTVKTPVVLVTNIKLNLTSKSIYLGNSFQLTPTVSPSNATNKSVTWSSSNTNIATVDNNGLVLGKGVGSATITARTNDGTNKTVSMTATIKNTTIPVSSITLNTTSKKMTVGQTFQLASIVNPSNATNKSVTWSSSNNAIATVNNTGLVTANNNGQVKITAKTVSGSKTATTTLTIIRTYNPLNIYLSPNGNDNNDGLTTNTPLLTLNKAQVIIKSLAANETVILKNINVIIKEGNYYNQHISWTYVNPGYRITFTAQNPSIRPVFIGEKGGDSVWFRLAYTGGNSNLTFKKIRVENYFTGLSFRGTNDIESEYNGNNVVDGMYFYNIGDNYTNPENNHVSPYAIGVNNSRNNIIKNSIFENVAGSGCQIHAVYLSCFSSNNQVTNNTFKNVSCDPIRVRNGSNNNIVSSNTFESTGKYGVISEWYCINDKDCSSIDKLPPKAVTERRSNGNIFTNNILLGKYTNGRIYAGYKGEEVYQTYLIIQGKSSDPKIIKYSGNKCGPNKSNLSDCPSQP